MEAKGARMSTEEEADRAIARGHAADRTGQGHDPLPLPQRHVSAAFRARPAVDRMEVCGESRMGSSGFSASSSCPTMVGKPSLRAADSLGDGGSYKAARLWA